MLGGLKRNQDSVLYLNMKTIAHCRLVVTAFLSPDLIPNKMRSLPVQSQRMCWEANHLCVQCPLKICSKLYLYKSNSGHKIKTFLRTVTGTWQIL